MKKLTFKYEVVIGISDEFAEQLLTNKDTTNQAFNRIKDQLTEEIAFGTEIISVNHDWEIRDTKESEEVV